MKLSAPGPLASAEFAETMAALGPFEEAPHIAVACSGGPDSMALALLASHWVRSCGGAVTALVVDHGMRPDSAEEAEMVRAWLTKAAVSAVVLTHPGRPPSSDRQAAARRARYALMREWCRNSGVLHLLLGHHLQDQAETFLLRLARGSGVDGLAAMAPVQETADVRLLRPLLGIPRERLLATLVQEGLRYVLDPSNDDRAFARVRMRAILPTLRPEGLTGPRLAATARRMRRARAALDAATTTVLAKAAAVYPEGYAVLTLAPLVDAPEEVGLRALSRLLVCIGGNSYGPRLERLERLYRWLSGGPSGRAAGRTLAGCRIVWRGERLLVCRELAAVHEPVAVTDCAVWDNRFRLAPEARLPDGSRMGGLGRSGWEDLLQRNPKARRTNLPAEVRYSLPAVRDLDDLVAVPHLSYRWDREDPMALPDSGIAFAPLQPLSTAAVNDSAGFP